MSDNTKLESYYYKFLQDILLKALEQNKVVESYLLKKDFANALKELQNINERLEDCSKAFSLLEIIKTQFSDNDKTYN